MQIAVIGGGVVGVCTAYFLAGDGHEVVVVERQTNVAEGASFGSAGPLSPVHALPWSAPAMPRRLLRLLLRSEGPVWVASRVDRSLWRWARRWIAESEIDRHQTNRERAFRLAAYSQDTMRMLQQEHDFAFEQTEGHLRLYRTARERESAEGLHAFLAGHAVSHQVLEPAQVYEREPALNRGPPLAGALSLPQDVSGNCPLFSKHLRNAAEARGVHFHFGSQVDVIEPAQRSGGPLVLHMGDSRFPVDAAVVAAGAGSQALLAPLGLRLPFYPVRTYSATATIRNFDDAPLASLADTASQVAVTRMGTRIRLAGTAELGQRSEAMREGALRMLLKAGQDWFPDAANYNAATLWSGALPTLPDGPPVLGPTPVRNLYLNIGHAANGWAMAAGAGRLLTDLIAGRAPDIDPDGLTLSRYG